MARSKRMGVSASPEQQERRDIGPLTGRGHARRAALLDAARRVFEERGFLDTRVADIAAEAKVAQGTFYTYFDSKDAIFQAVASRVAGDMIIELGASRPLSTASYERTHAAMRRYVESYRSRAKILALIEQVGTFTPEMKRIRLQMREAHVDRLARGIEHQQELGIADPALDPVLAAEVLGSMVDSTCHLWLTLGHEFEENDLLDTLTRIYLNGIGARDEITDDAAATARDAVAAGS